MYEIRFRGNLGRHWQEWFDGFSFWDESGEVTILPTPSQTSPRSLEWSQGSETLISS